MSLTRSDMYSGKVVRGDGDRDALLYNTSLYVTYNTLYNTRTNVIHTYYTKC
jgi:hypothetical protein